MTDPMVAAIMLTRDRPAMARRAIAAFRAQTYGGGLKLLILDTTPKERREELTDAANEVHAWHYHPRADKPCDETIGALRNKANGMCLDADILVHWDDDDLSHPRRIEEQVALLQASKKQCVGYNEVLFWDTRPDPDAYFEASDGSKFPDEEPLDEAWLYRNPHPRWVAGASMCYWSSAWEVCPFDDAPHEDQRWWVKNADKCMGTAGISEGIEPRIVCQMHAGGTEQIPRRVMESGGGGVWKRVPEWDNFCQERMRCA